MQSPVSVPKAPPQPDSAFYSVQELALFKTYSRESYRADFGVEAPPFDPSRVIKTWFDSTADTSAPDNVAVYKTIFRNDQNQWGFRQLVMPASEAATVNLPGKVSYPKYVVQPTTATRGGGGITALYLSLESDARALMEEVGGSDLGDEGATAVFPVHYPPEEPRRLWYFQFRGKAVNAGALIYNRNKNGVGAPGKWDFSTGVPVWKPAPEPPTGLGDTRPAREMPMRDLRPNERLQVGLMGVGIARTDLAEKVKESSGQFTEQDRATLQMIYQMLTKLTGNQQSG